jgi:hypothetical protein
MGLGLSKSKRVLGLRVIFEGGIRNIKALNELPRAHVHVLVL